MRNGYRDWRDARSNEFFVLGSRDETSGCQLCVASIADDGSLTLRLRMPDCLANQHGKYLGHPTRAVRLRTRAGAGGVGEQRRVRRPIGASMVIRRLGPPHWVRPSATVSSGTPKGWRVFASY